ncbi:hypothetical protein [Actinomadura sp. DC4]|uniref:hypothetical protein n=1 Tax=Actinomadura sp. DC4 TaxID=3055069 RepID=UPI0025B0167B|nr:hypothetical protein [Actinomadura sp. DC4]MDN3359564.1 hypothetical protein [Actinomadura sp. DC4]
MTQDPGWFVHLGRLSAATEGAVETAGGLRKRTGELAPGCVAAVSGHEGMQCAAALAQCHGRFTNHLHGHADAIHGIGARLAESHTTYTLAETKSGEETRTPSTSV